MKLQILPNEVLTANTLLSSTYQKKDNILAHKTTRLELAGCAIKVLLFQRKAAHSSRVSTLPSARLSPQCGLDKLSSPMAVSVARGVFNFRN